MKTRPKDADGDGLDRERPVPEAEIVASLLAAAGTPRRVLLHQHLVAEVAWKIGRLVAPYVLIDLALLAAAAELHDIAKTQPDHAAKGADLLDRKGFPEVAKIVREHTDLSKTPSIEAEILYLADKYVNGTRLEAIEERETKIRKKFADDREALKAALRRMERAREIEHRIEKITGICPLLKYVS